MRKLIYLILGFICIVGVIWCGAESYPGPSGFIRSKKKGVFPYGHVSVFPPAQSDTYVKATGPIYGIPTYSAYRATDPTRPLIGSYANNAWVSTTPTNQRFHIDLGAAKIVTKIYYENIHHNGGTVLDIGVKNFTFQGSNTDASFADTTYATDTGWDNITTNTTVMDIHVSANIPDPKYIGVTNTTAYRYYAFKFADNWGSGTSMGIRRIELQVSKGSE